VYRADYHAMFLHLVCATSGVRIRIGAAVRDVQRDQAFPCGPSITLASGEVLHADIKGTLQKVVTGLNAPMPTDDAASLGHRPVIGTNPMLQDPELRPFVRLRLIALQAAVGSLRTWICIVRRAKKEYNPVLILDDGLVESWTEEGSGDKMPADFADFEPRCVTEM
jgi:salicylate hydroxylase